ncbi:hypothetical protein ACFSJW_02595 [Flavobacterium artemisiae]|uniref:Uncharacterized protein n=1 Tax=Flavobacterium artemisiae TaxID=2126556 RepID=A0ABW4HJE6_9FLAO
MKADFFNNSLISILPLFVFILGCISINKTEVALYGVENYNFTFWFLVSFGISYLFLNDAFSVLITIVSTINTALGILFCMDFLEIKSSSIALLILIVFLALSVLTNIYLIIAVHQNKKPLDHDAVHAVSQALKTYFKAVVLTLVTLMLLLIFSLDSIEINHIKLIIAAGTVFLINSCLLLPLLCRLFLGHINEERMQDDLKLSFSEKLSLKLNQKIDDSSAKIVWIISPIISNKTICFVIVFLTVVFGSFLFLTNEKMFFSGIDFQDHFFLILLLGYFFLLVFRYKSYVLALAPIMAIGLHYLLFWNVCNFLLYDSTILMFISFIGSVTVMTIGVFSQTDAAVNHIQNSGNIDEVILNGAAKIGSMLFVSVLLMTFFLLYAVYSDRSANADCTDLIIAAVILISSSLCTLFPFPAFLKIALDFHKYLNKPKKKQIKSIYL